MKSVMSEVMRPEIIKPKKATLADRAISWMCDHWQKIKPDKFSTRRNKIIEEVGQSTSTREVEERNLEVVEEVVGLYDRARSTSEEKPTADIVNKERQPLGENINDVNLLFFGDTHLPGGNLEEEVYEKNNPYLFFKKVRALFLGIKKDGLKSARKIWQNEDGRLDELREEIREEHGIDSFNAFLALKNAFIRRLMTDKDSFSEDSKVVFANVGDNISNEQKMGDVAYSAAQLEETRAELENMVGVKTVLTKTQGNHDTDLINYGLEHDAFDRRLFGSQVFLQNVGEDLVILSLNTNLYSTFWHEHLERRKFALKQRIDKVNQMVGDSSEKDQLQEINDRELVALTAIREEMKKQTELIEEAKNSGKRIVLMGHEKGYLEQAMGGNLKDTNVVTVISGHDHKHKQKIKKNRHGERVHYLNVGANKKVKTETGKKSVLSGFSVRIKDTAEEGLSITVNEVIPNEADYRSAVYSM